MDDRLELEISCRQVDTKRRSGETLLLLDCREPEEVSRVRLEDVMTIPMGEVSQRLLELAPFRQQPLVVYCHHGGRSLQVATWLREQGFPSVQSMAGGIDRWAVEIEPGMARY